MPATLLLVDDNAIQAATRQTILKRAGYFVIVTLSPERALEQLRSGDLTAPIDLIVTDHMMPGMTGVAFIAGVRQFAPQVPVLVVSGMPDVEEEYAQLNVVFRVKPFLPDDLLRCIHKMLHTDPDASHGFTASSAQP